MESNLKINLKIILMKNLVQHQEIYFPNDQNLLNAKILQLYNNCINCKITKDKKKNHQFFIL